jgi:uncharacterized protein (DUF427 family)
MANLAPGFAAHRDYRIDLVPEPRRVRVEFAGATIADTTDAIRLEEQGHQPVLYIPEKDVRLHLMRPTAHHTRCPYKGEASYWTIEVPAADGMKRSENAVWAYLAPYDEMRAIGHYYAFYGSRVDQVAVG